MENQLLVNDLLKLISDLRCEECEADSINDELYRTGFIAALPFSRVNLETVLEKHGVRRVKTIDSEVIQFITSETDK